MSEDTAATARQRRRIVRPTGHGGWAVYIPGVERAVAVLTTRADAVSRAKRILATRGGGEVEVQQNGESLGLHVVAARTTRRFGQVPAPPRPQRRAR